MAGHILSPQAVTDIDEIAHFIARDSPASAERWLDEVTQLFELLGSHSTLGQRLVSPKYGEVRRHSRGNYLIYFRSLPMSIEIVRVLHAAREQDNLL